jgi:hypothetical protein
LQGLCYLFNQYFSFLLHFHKKQPSNQREKSKKPGGGCFLQPCPPVAAPCGGEGDGVLNCVFIAKQ